MFETLSSQNFIYWLDLMDLSHEEAASLLGVSLSTIQSYTRGERVPPHHTNHCRLLFLLKVSRLSVIPRKAGGFHA